MFSIEFDIFEGLIWFLYGLKIELSIFSFKWRNWFVEEESLSKRFLQKNLKLTLSRVFFQNNPLLRDFERYVLADVRFKWKTANQIVIFIILNHDRWLIKHVFPSITLLLCSTLLFKFWTLWEKKCQSLKINWVW